MHSRPSLWLFTDPWFSSTKRLLARAASERLPTSKPSPTSYRIAVNADVVSHPCVDHEQRTPLEAGSNKTSASRMLAVPMP